MSSASAAIPPSDLQGEEYRQSVESSLATLGQLDNVALHELSRLTLPEIDRLKREIADAGRGADLTGFLSHGLARLQSRTVSRERTDKDLGRLFQGANILQGMLGAISLAAPATVLSGYQKLISMIGRNNVDAFPEGTWQFYLEFGLREDAARHTNETTAFHRYLQALTNTTETMQGAAWLAAIARMVMSYDELIALVWQEFASLRLLRENNETLGKRALGAWAAHRPYRRSSSGEPYNTYRRRVFRTLLAEHLIALDPAARKEWGTKYAELGADLLAYQDQMSILAALNPERYREGKTPISLWRARLAVVAGGEYYLIPLIACDPQGQPLLFKAHGVTESLIVDTRGDLRSHSGHRLVTDRSGEVRFAMGGEQEAQGYLRPATMPELYKYMEGILASAERSLRANVPRSKTDSMLAETPRVGQEVLRGKLDKATRAELDLLRLCPVILHWDSVSRRQPLSDVRRTHRGIGDHALTVIRTEGSFIFDQSHIFFDGAWGMAVAEVLTNEALACLAEIRAVASPERLASRTVKPAQRLTLASTPGFEKAVREQMEHVAVEVCAENSSLEFSRVQIARRLLAQRGVKLTFNDVLVLYRTLHGRWYYPTPQLQDAISQFRATLAEFGEGREVAKELESLLVRTPEANPALLIPMDASAIDPKERLFPTTFRLPTTMLDLGERHLNVYNLLQTYKRSSTRENHAALDVARREYLAHIKYFGLLLDTLKSVTMRGEGFNTAAIRLIGNLPQMWQHTLDQIPQKIGALNEVIKGDEVFSNVGRVAPGSSLERFSSARDDGSTKLLVWGILTDDQERVHISLRDFRPHVRALLRLGQQEKLVRALAQDFLDEYVRGVNRFVTELAAIAVIQSSESIS